MRSRELASYIKIVTTFKLCILLTIITSIITPTMAQEAGVTDSAVLQRGTSTPADIVKRLHAHLREEAYIGHSFQEVWSRLLSDRASLAVYSQAMNALAVGSWEQGFREKEGSRISWCVQMCEEYFSSQGTLYMLLLKDMRRRDHAMPTLVSFPYLPYTMEDVIKVVEEWTDKRLKLLDVGSCYNPFLRHPLFEVTAIDIAPANKSVLECDFLSVAICAKTKSTSTSASPPNLTTSALLTPASPPHLITSSLLTCASPPNLTPSISSTCISSPLVLLAESYDVVVFSLLLSYLPYPQQRFECCVKAHRLLRMHALLLVITPDSSHQNKHTVMMKDWKICIEAIGFHRWKYLKETHLHCMAFRKTRPSRELEERCRLQELLHIPQDKHLKHCNTQSYSSQENFLSHLPFFDSMEQVS